MDSQPPPKPWERRIPGTIGTPVNYRSTDFGPPAGLSVSTGPPVLTRVAPPLPPRPVQQSYRPAYSSFTSSYSPYGGSMYGGYSPYSYSYSGGYGHGGYGRFSQAQEVVPSRFVQQAEESSRGAFQSIESIVQAFASVSMMLDATFSAVYNSFRAVLDVANHLTRLRAHLTRVLSAFALVRTLRYLYRRLQRLLGRGSNAEVEDLWADSVSDALATSAPRGPGAAMDDQAVKSWPILLFFAVVLGGPYLIWKLLSSATGSEDRATNWATGEDDHVVARAEYDFTASTEEEVSFRAGDMLNLAPKEQQPRVRGWLLASLDGQTTGLVPANYVKVLGKRKGHKHVETEWEQGSSQASRTNVAANVNPSPEESLECAYKETQTSKSNSSAVVNIPDKTDL
uniref:peroxisome biogenesis factor 13 n=1 Tax=Doryrhamphus excisus TaxID=161450 RepID=UPI0025AE5A2F|nr:peroxisome biogenesis factor 13 [Doryrhamphus excisus]